MVHMQVLIKQAKVLDTGSDFHNKVVDILIEDGKIKDIATAIDAKADQVIQGDGLYVSPGWVDILADYSEPGHEQKETIASGLDAAAAGGFTNIFLAPNTEPTVSTKSIIEFVQKKAFGNVVSLRPLGSISQQIEGKVIAEMMDMQAHGAIAFTDGWKPIQNGGLMLKALEYVKAMDGILMQLPIDASLSAGGLMHEGPVSTFLGMAGIPTLAETTFIYRDIELLRYTDSKLHITGVSSKEGLEMIRQAKAEGLNITCSVTPYHLAFTDESLKTYNSIYKVSPPLRSEADRQALLAGLKDGTVDCVASHHRPQEWDAKTREFDYASEGMNLQESVYNVLMTVAEEAGIERIASALSSAPRKIFGMDAATVTKGENAELTIFTDKGTTAVTKENLRSASANTPYIGEELKGKVVAIINNGQIHING